MELNINLTYFLVCDNNNNNTNDNNNKLCLCMLFFKLRQVNKVRSSFDLYRKLL